MRIHATPVGCSLAGIVLMAFVLASCSRPRPHPAKGGSAAPLETVEEYAILRLPVKGFDRLSLNDKLLAYHLYQAAVAGRDIHFDQLHRRNLEIRQVCEEILLHSDGIDKKLLGEIATYLKLQYLNTGIYGKFTYAKLLPPKRITYGKFEDAMERAKRNGAVFQSQGKREVREYADSLRRTIFDPAFEPFVTSRSPKPGEDLLTASANNYYDRGIHLSDLQRFTDLHPLNSRLAREGKKIVEQVARAGDPSKKIPPGIYAPYLAKVAGHLDEAVEYATPENAKSLRLLAEYYRTGDPKLFTKYNIAWLAYSKPTVDIINGFIEEYLDPREKKGAWEGMTYFVDEESSGWLREVASKADYYESHAPISDAYKRSGVKPIANMVEVLVEAGEAGPISFSGVNLPNDQALRVQYGSKNVLLWNTKRARDEIIGEKAVREFVIPEDQEILLKHRQAAIEILVGFHETLGHASGQANPKLTEDPSHYLPGYYSWLEEERADLLALHHAWDPETFRIRKDWSDEAARAMYKQYPVSELIGLAEIPLGSTNLEEPHQVGGLFAVNFFRKKWGVVEEVRREVGGHMKTFWVVRDENIPRMRQAVDELLRELQRIKSEGDLPAIRKLAQGYGAATYDSKLATEIRDRKKKLGLPSYCAYVYPELQLIEQGGRPVDVRLVDSESFLRQQLKWSGYGAKEIDLVSGR
ncbi:MAG: hypothetical protein V1495_11000 [Pseudomonadota bacterium]